MGGPADEVWRGEPDRRIARLGDEVRDFLLGLCVPGSPRALHQASGMVNIRARLSAIERTTRFEARNLTWWERFDGTGVTTRTNARFYRRGLGGLRVVNPTCLADFTLFPLTSMYSPDVVAAPVRQTMIMLDRERLVFGGPIDASGRPTMWATSDPEALQAAWELTEEQRLLGRPVTVLEVSPTNERRLWVLIHVLAGDTDQTIARRLGVSTRLVQKDVAAIKEMGGVSSRMELPRALGYIENPAPA